MHLSTTQALMELNGLDVGGVALSVVRADGAGVFGVGAPAAVAAPVGNTVGPNAAAEALASALHTQNSTAGQQQHQFAPPAAFGAAGGGGATAGGTDAAESQAWKLDESSSSGRRAGVRLDAAARVNMMVSVILVLLFLFMLSYD